MTAVEGLVVAGATGLVVLTWIFLFRTDRRDLGGRTWIAAAVVAVGALVGAVALGRTDELVGPVEPVEVLVGATVGLAWLVATHAGAAVLGRLAPSFRRATEDVYRLVDPSSRWRLVGPLTAMAVAEELLFRGVVQEAVGLPVAVVLYAGVQLIEGRWPLVLAAALGGLVWGGLYEWRDGLVAPSLAHVVWTVTLALLWPVRPGIAARRPR